MYLRLAFSVAAHLETEILVVDEVLAVGDAAFQRKCLGKMDEVSRQGRTVVFVSHNTAAVENLCQTVAVLEEGRVVHASSAPEAIEFYMRDIVGKAALTTLADRTDRQGTGALRITSFHVEDDQGNPVLAPRSGQTCFFAMGYETRDGRDLRNVVASFAVHDNNGMSLILHRTDFMHQDFTSIPGRGQIRCELPDLPLAPAGYSLGIHIEAGSEIADAIAHAARIEVEPGDFYGTGSAGLPGHSPVLIRGSWSVTKAEG
jgi:lipopolysaccharide transport system ATP-binding protein